MGRVFNSRGATVMKENRLERWREIGSSLSYGSRSFGSFYAESPVPDSSFDRSHQIYRLLELAFVDLLMWSKRAEK